MFQAVKKLLSMPRKYHNHTLQTYTWHHEEASADPESFVRGGPTLARFFFLVEEGRADSGNQKWAIIGPPAKRHLNGVSLAGQ